MVVALRLAVKDVGVAFESKGWVGVSDAVCNGTSINFWFVEEADSLG
jgi:hypothetical protein